MIRAPKPPYNTIPDPTLDVEGLHRTVLALKTMVEQIVGTREAPDGARKASIYVQGPMPRDAADGDFWFSNVGESTSLSISTGGNWLKVWP